MRVLYVALLMAALTGCTTLNVSTPGSLAQPTGLSYSLPMRVLAVDLVYDRSRGFAISTNLLPSAPDPKAPTYLLIYQGSPFDKDTVQWTTEDGLLTGVSAATVSKLLDTVQGAGESIGSLAALENDASATAITIIQVNVDPTDAVSVASASQELTAALQAFAADERARQALEPAVKKTDEAGKATKALRTLILDKAKTARIDISGDIGAGPAQTDAPCTVGICYRPVRFRQVAVKINGVTFTQLGMTIPNGMPAVAFPIKRTGASDSSTTLTLDRGVLSGVNIVKEAEGPNIVRVPGTFVGGVIKGFTDTLTARKGSVSAETDLVKAQTDRAKAQADLIAARDVLKKAKADSGLEAYVNKEAYLGWLPGGLSAPANSSPTAEATSKVSTAPIKPGGKAGATPAQGAASNPDKPTDGGDTPPGTGGTKTK